MRQTHPAPRLAIMLSAPLLLAGCLSLGGNVPDSLMTLSSTAQPAPAASRSGPIASALIVLVPTVPQKLRTPRVPVQSSDTSIAYLQDAQWVEPPARLFQRLLTETVAMSGTRVVLNESELVTGPGELLAGELLDFGVDARTSEAVVVFQAARVQQDGTLIIQQRFEARERLDAITPQSVGPALNRSANRVAADVARWIQG